MQSNDIVMHVSDETAEVMEEISDQLVGEISEELIEKSDARFDEVLDAFEGAVTLLNSKLTNLSDSACEFNKQLASNQKELMDRFRFVVERQGVILKKLEALDKDVKYLKLPFFKRWFTKG